MDKAAVRGLGSDLEFPYKEKQGEEEKFGFWQQMSDDARPTVYIIINQIHDLISMYSHGQTRVLDFL